MSRRLVALPGAFVVSLMLAQAGCSQPEPLNLLPMYGSSSGDREMTPADRKFVEEMVGKHGSRESAAKDAMSRGWSAIRSDDWRLAMKRFNQAWLLTPDDPDVFWGFGSALGLKGQYADAIGSFEQARSLGQPSAPLLCDFAYTYLLKAQRERGVGILHERSLSKANELLDEARRLDPDYELIYANLAVAAFEAGSYDNAWLHVKEAEEMGGRSLDPAFLRDLSARRPRPD